MTTALSQGDELMNEPALGLCSDADSPSELNILLPRMDARPIGANGASVDAPVDESRGRPDQARAATQRADRCNKSVLVERAAGRGSR